MEGKKLNTQLKNSTILLEYPSVVNRKTRLVIVFENQQKCLILKKISLAAGTTTTLRSPPTPTCTTT